MNDLLQTSKLAAAAAIALFVYLVSKVVYDLYIHPLAGVPGPKLNAITQLPWLIRRLNGDQVSYAHELHLKYGTNVRVGPNEISTISPSAWKDVHGHRLNGRGNMPKDLGTLYDADPMQNGGQNMVAANDEVHARQRRIFTHAFSDRALRDQEPLLKHYSDLGIKKMQEAAENEGKVDVVRFFNFITFDFIADCVFGEPLHMLENMEYSPWVSRIFSGIKFSTITRYSRVYPLLNWSLQVFLSYTTPLKKARAAHFKYSSDRVDKRLARGETDHPDFWTLVAKAEQKDNKLTVAEMHTTAQLFMTAGTETTATLLSGLVYYLCLNPEKAKKLTEEIRGEFKSADEMTTLALPRLKYLFYCLEEALRIYPPVAIGLPRLVPAPGAEFDGLNLPAGTRISFPHWPAYHSESLFARPHDFVPERWEANPPEEFKNDRKDAFFPFSNGPRNCLGKNLAYAEMRLILAKLLWHFDIELCPESKNWTDQKVWILWDKSPLFVKLTPAVR